MSIQPIYIYKFDYYVDKSTLPDNLRYRYFILDSKVFNSEDKVHCLHRIDSLNAFLFINKEINNNFNFNFKSSDSWWDLKSRVSRDNKCYLNSKYFYLIDFKDLLALLSISKGNLTELLQLVLAKWDDWY